MGRMLACLQQCETGRAPDRWLCFWEGCESRGSSQARALLLLPGPSSRVGVLDVD